MNPHQERGQLMPHAGRQERLRRYWDKHAGSYDRQMAFFDRHLFAGSRDWVCSRAEGQVLEVAIGTGLNLACYPDGVRLTGMEWSPAMLQVPAPPPCVMRETADWITGAGAILLLGRG